MDWQRFLQIAGCPRCQARLHRCDRELACARGHVFLLNRRGIPLFDPQAPPPSERAQHEREEAASVYAGMRAFAAEALGRGESEGLYRSVSDLTVRSLGRGPAQSILDLGCGAGRVLVDAATAFPRALAVGIDHDEGALEVADSIAGLEGAAVHLDLRPWGFGLPVLTARHLPNYFLAQADACHLPFVRRDVWPGFDLVICVNLLDRVSDPARVLASVASVLCPSGVAVLVTPMNWQQPGGSAWSMLPELTDVCRACEEQGLHVSEAFDGLVYRELLDRRGSALDWRVAVIAARHAAGTL